MAQWSESTRFPPMWPGLESRTRHQMWVEFIVKYTIQYHIDTPLSGLFSDNVLIKKVQHIGSVLFRDRFDLERTGTFELV